MSNSVRDQAHYSIRVQMNKLALKFIEKNGNKLYLLTYYSNDYIP